MQVDLYSLNSEGVSVQLEEKGDWHACAAVSNTGTDSQGGQRYLPSQGVPGGSHTHTSQVVSRLLSPSQALPPIKPSRSHRPGHAVARLGGCPRRGGCPCGPGPRLLSTSPRDPAAPCAALPNLLAWEDQEGWMNSSGSALLCLLQ